MVRVVAVGFEKLVNRVEWTLESTSHCRKRIYSSRKCLRCELVANQHVSGSLLVARVPARTNSSIV